LSIPGKAYSTGGVVDRLWMQFDEACRWSSEALASPDARGNSFRAAERLTDEVLIRCLPGPPFRRKGRFEKPYPEDALRGFAFSLLLCKGGLYEEARGCLRRFFQSSFRLLACKVGVNPGHPSDIEAVLSAKPFRAVDGDLNLTGRARVVSRRLREWCDPPASFPRFSPEMLDGFLTDLEETSDLVLACSIALRPILLFPMPLESRFGDDAPLTGLLDEDGVKALRGALKPATREYLMHRFESDPRVAAVRKHIKDLPAVQSDRRSRAQGSASLHELERLLVETFDGKGAHKRLMDSQLGFTPGKWEKDER
jgi:hypothetical protein